MLNEFKKLIGEEIVERHKDEFEDLAKRLKKAIRWKLETESEEEREQADIAIEVLSIEIPVTIAALVADEVVADRASQAVKFGIRVADKLIT